MVPARATLILRIPSSLHQRLKQEAHAADLSLNKYCSLLLSRKSGEGIPGESPASATLACGWHRAAQLGELCSSVLGTWGNDIDGLALIGSYARGRATANSDIDLLVVLSRPATLDRDVYTRWQPRRLDGHEVSPIFVQIPGEGEKTGGLWFEVALDGIVLFDRDLNLSRFLCGVRELVADGRVRRMVTHGHPYWVHVDKGIRNTSSVRRS